MFYNITQTVDTIKKNVGEKKIIDVLIDKGDGSQPVLNKCVKSSWNIIRCYSVETLYLNLNTKIPFIVNDVST